MAGLIIDGGKDTGRRRIYVKSVVKDGAAYLDGFIQVNCNNGDTVLFGLVVQTGHCNR